MTILEDSADVITRYEMTQGEVGLAQEAAKLIGRYRQDRHGTWTGPTAETLVRREVRDMSRQIRILSLACLLERESREKNDDASPVEESSSSLAGET